MQLPVVITDDPELIGIGKTTEHFLLSLGIEMLQALCVLMILTS